MDSFENAIKISSEISNIHIKKNESLYFEIVGTGINDVEIGFMNKTENLLLFGMSIEIYDSSENIKLYSNTITRTSITKIEFIEIEDNNIKEGDYIKIISKNDNKFLYLTID